MFSLHPQTAVYQESSPRLQCSKFLLGFHHVDVIDQIIGHKVGLNFGPPLFPGGRADVTRLKAPTLYHMAGLSGMANPHPV